MQKKRIIIVLIVGILIIMTLFTVINIREIKEEGIVGFFAGIFNPASKKSLVTEFVGLGDQDILEYSVYGDTVVYAHKQGITAVNLKGEWLWENSEVSFIKPYIKVTGDYLFVVEKGGSVAVLLKDKKIVWKSNFEKGIISADVNESGFCVVVHNADNYSAVITGIKPNVTESNEPDILFTRSFMNEQIIAAIISKDSTQVMLHGVGIDGEELTGAISFLDIANGEIYSSIKTNKQIYPVIKYVNGDIGIAVNKESFMKIRQTKLASTDGDYSKDLWNKEFGEIFAFDISKDHIVTATGNSGIYGNAIETDIVIMDFNGKVVEQFTVPGKISHVNAGKGIFSISYAGQVSFYDYEGNKQFDYETTSDINKVLHINDDNFVIVTQKDVYILKTQKLKEE